MRDPKRIPKMLDKIKEIWEKHPDLRLCQLLDNAVPMVVTERSLFYLEDHDLCDFLDRTYPLRGSNGSKE